MCKLRTNTACLCKYSVVTPQNLKSYYTPNQKGKCCHGVGASAVNLIRCNRELVAAVSCHGLHAGSLRKAAGSIGGGRMGAAAVCCARSRPVEAPPRGSIQPFACCGSCTQACYLYGHHRRRAGSSLQSPSCIPPCQVEPLSAQVVEDRSGHGQSARYGLSCFSVNVLSLL